MFLPIGDSPNPRFTPWLTYALIAANVLVFLALLPLHSELPPPGDPLLREYLRALEGARPDLPAEALAGISRYDLVLFQYGFRPAAPELLDLLCSLFLHGGWLHLLGNMLYLWIFGDNVEHRLGRPLFVVVYLATGAAAALGDLALRPDSPIPAVGASGAISGLLGCYFLWFPRNTVRVLLVLFPLYVGTVDLPVRLVLGLYVLVDNLLPVLLVGAAGGVSYGAHLGGFVGGLAVALLDRSLRHRGAPEVERARLIDEGEALERAGELRRALSAYLAVLGAPASALDGARAHLGAARIYLAAREPAAAYQHLEALRRDPGAPPEQLAEARALFARLAELTRRAPRWP